MKQVVPSDIAAPVRRTKGSTVTFVNQSATDVYVDSDYQRLNATVQGAAPDGTKLAANGGQLQVTDYPGLLWVRAATQTTIEVQP